MALQLASTTDTPEQIAQTMKDAGLEPEPPEVEAGSPAPEAPTGEAKPAGDETAAASEAAPEPKPAGEQPPAGETTDEDDVPVIEVEAGKELSKGVRKELNRRQRRFAEERDKRIAAETRLTELERQFAELKASSAAKPPEPPKPEEKPPEPKKPLTLKDYTQEGGPQFHEGEDYDDAAQRYFDDRLKEMQSSMTPEKTRAEVQAELDRQARKDEAAGYVDAARERHPDFDEKVTDQVQISAAMIDAAWEDPETAPEVFYYLATHPDEHKRVMELTSHPANADPNTILRANRAAARETMRIQSLVKQAPPAPPAATPPAKAPAPTATRKISQAPAPIEPVSSGASPVSRKDPDSMSPSEYARWVETPEGREWYHSRR